MRIGEAFAKDFVAAYPLIYSIYFFRSELNFVPSSNLQLFELKYFFKSELAEFKICSKQNEIHTKWR